MIRQSQCLRRSSPTHFVAAWTWVWLLSVAACATESNDPPPDGASGSLGDQGGTSGSGGAAASTGGKAPGAAGSSGSSGSSGKAGAGSMAGAAGAGAGGKASGGASTGGAGGASVAGGGNGNTAGKAGGGQAGRGGGAGAGAGAGAGGGAGSGSGGGSAQCASGIAFCDDFEDQNANGWTKSGGTWTVVSDGGDWVYEGGNASEEAYAGDLAWTDQTVEANVKVTSFGGTSDSYRVGIMGRHSGGSSFYVFALGGDGNLTLRKSTSTPSGSLGTCGALAAGIASTAWFTLKMTISGSAGAVQIRTYLNGTLKHDCMTTSSTVASGRAGVLSYGSNTVAHFDDVRVTTP